MPADSREASYLRPYADAARTYGGKFGSLLWASPATQAARFDAIMRIVSMQGQSILDVGCGRADLLDHLLKQNIRPADYVGIEAVGPLADAAEAKALPRCTILRADFVAEPVRMFIAADVIVFSGSLNTLADSAFYATLTRAFEATAKTVVFNFLSSDRLAGRDYLYWRRPADVLRFVRTLGNDVTSLSDYLDGDTTVRLDKKDE